MTKSDRLRAAERAAEKAGNLKRWKHLYRAARRDNSITASIRITDERIIADHHRMVCEAARLDRR